MEAAAITVDEVLRAGRLLFGPQFEAHGDWRASLKRAFHRRALETHPDRAATLGRAPGELAREFQAVTDAFHMLSAFRGVLRPPHRHEPRPATAARPPPRPAPAERREAPPPPPRTASANAPPRAAPPQPPPPAGSATPRAEAASARATPHAPPPRPEPAREDPAARTAPPPPHVAREEPAPRTAPPPPHAQRARTAREPHAAHREPGATAHPPRPEPARHAAPRRFATSFPPRRLRFAEFLYYAGRVAFIDVVQAVVWQRRQRPNLGDIAVSFGYLTQAQVSEILARRRQEARIGTLFAEFAVQAGFLTRYQQLVILGHQKGRQRPIGEFFIERGLIRPEEIPEIRRQIILHNATCLDAFA